MNRAIRAMEFGHSFQMRLSDYNGTRCTSVNAGTTWLRTRWGFFFLSEYTPNQMGEYFAKHPDGTITVMVHKEQA